MKAGAIIFVVTFVREAAGQVARAAYRIASGQPENQMERAVADALRQFLQRLINRSRLMNPEVP